MKNRLINFFKLRRHNDAVKMICMFGLAGLACLANGGDHIWEICCAVNAPAEYVLMGEGKVSQKSMDEMGKNQSVMRVSRQMECPVELMYGGKEGAISCTLLSAEYLEAMFHADISAGTRKIWMNRAAFSEWKEQLGEGVSGMAEMEGGEGDSGMAGMEDESGSGVLELDVRYALEGESFSQGKEAPSQEGNVPVKYRSAKLIVVGSGGEDEEGAVYMAEEESRLQKEAEGLRVQFAKHDLDGLQALRKPGYELQNEAQVVAEECDLETRMLHIKYSLFSCALCVAAAFGLKSQVKRSCYSQMERFH